MRSFNVKLWGCIGIICVVAMIIACGGADLMDETGQRYTASVAIQDLGENTLNVDVIQSFCDSDVEDYGDASAEVTVGVSADALGITLQSYTIEYIPLESEDGSGNLVTPPTLDGPLVGGNLGIDIDSGGSATFDITCMSVDTKNEYRIKAGYVYYTDTAAGMLVITAKEADVAAKQTDVDNKQQDIVNLLLSDPTADTTGLELQLETLEAQLADLEAELDALYYSLDPAYTPLLLRGRYKIRITLQFEDTELQDRTIVREATVWLGPVDNC